MRSQLRSLFIDHPASVDETYFEHLKFATMFALMLSGAAMAAFVHALIPALFEKTASNIIRKLFHRIDNR